MDIVQKCERDNTIIHCFEFDEIVVLRFIKAIENNKRTGSEIVQQLIVQWLDSSEVK